MRARILSKVVRAWEAVQPRVEVNGTRVPLRQDNCVLMSWQPSWKTEIMRRTLAARPGLFVDIGANVGQTLLDYLDCSTHNGYVGFEPNPRCVERIEAIIDASYLTDCTIVPIGLAETNGVTKLFVSATNNVDSGATLVAELRPGVDLKPVYVPAFRFDDIRPSVIDERAISLIKIDVEGGELTVLRGMAETILKDRPLIICEVLTRYYSGSPEAHSRHCRELMSLVRRLGYAVLRVEKTAHEGGVSGYTPVDSFPEEIHTYANEHMCDYVFTPHEAKWPAASDE